MKSRRALFFALGCGVLSLLLLSYYVSQKDKWYGGKYESITVLIAGQDIERYKVIEESMLMERPIPKDFKEPDALTREDLGSVIGYRADSTIKKGSQITLTRISREGEARISLDLQKGDRACTVAVNEISGVAGLIRPGDHVDVVGVFKTVDEKTRVATQAEAVTLLQNVQILAVGKNYMFDSLPSSRDSKIGIPTAASTSFSNVTVSLSPRDCMDLAVAQQVGTITLTLRSYLNRFGGDQFPELKTKHSTTASATGIQAPLEITAKPRWIEMRGAQSMMVP